MKAEKRFAMGDLGTEICSTVSVVVVTQSLSLSEKRRNKEQRRQTKRRHEDLKNESQKNRAQP